MSTGYSIDDWKAIKSEMLRQGVLQQKLEASSCGGYFCKGHTLLISIVALLLNIFKNSLANYHGKLTGALVLSGSRLRHDLAYVSVNALLVWSGATGWSNTQHWPKRFYSHLERRYFLSFIEAVSYQYPRIDSDKNWS